MDWTAVDELVAASPSTYEELIKLDQEHHNNGLGDLWMASKRRSELIKTIRGRTVTMSEIDDEQMVIFPGVIDKAIREANGKEVPVAIYRNGSRIEVGSAVLSDEKEGLIAQIKLYGEHALDILKDGAPAFSIGYPSMDVDITNRNGSFLPPQPARMNRWERRRGKGSKR